MKRIVNFLIKSILRRDICGIAKKNATRRSWKEDRGYRYSMFGIYYNCSSPYSHDRKFFTDISSKNGENSRRR